MYISMKYQHNVDLQYTITKFMGISNFMLFVNKQTFDAPSNAGVQCIYARNVDISLTQTWKQLTIMIQLWQVGIQIQFYIYDTLAQHKHLFWGVWFQSMPL